MMQVAHSGKRLIHMLCRRMASLLVRIRLIQVRSSVLVVVVAVVVNMMRRGYCSRSCH